jgi:CHAT domain-containing protein
LRSPPIAVVAPLLAVLLLWPAAVRAQPPGAAAPAPDGEAALRRGDFEAAAGALEEAARRAEARGDAAAELEARLRLATAEEGLGRYEAAHRSLERALALAKRRSQPAALAAVHGALGNVYVALGSRDDAERELRSAVRFAEAAGSPALEASAQNNLGNLYAVVWSREGGEEAARLGAQAYAKATAEARAAGDAALEARSLANAARFAVDRRDAPAARELLDRAFETAQPLPASHANAYTLLHLGRSHQRLDAERAAPDAVLLKRAHAALTRAEAMAREIGDARASAWALGYLGELYARERRHEEALGLTQRAVFQAQRVDAADSLYLWHAQAGRLQWELGHPGESLSQYQASVDLLAELRPAMVQSYGSPARSFREGAGRIYSEYVDRLLRRAARAPDPEAARPDLLRAQQLMERLKAAELRDYFQDDCVDAYREKIRSLESASRNAAIVYPVLLDDRLEILVSGPGGIRQFTVDVPRAELEEEVQLLRRLLEKRTTRQFLPHAQKVYGWLVAPIAAELEPADIETLVFVPDGALRMVPMSALHDGERFLVERLPIATTPGLELTDPRPLDRESPQLFLGGLSEAVQGYPPLDHVPRELDAIRALYGGELLLDDSFQVKNVERRMLNQPYSIVHIASHGEFGGNSDDTYLLTHEGRITMDQLADYVGATRFREQPLELITLSACETAAGDERSALGLAGLAIKSGARSALGTLWKVNDLAASDLIVSFYEALQEPGVSRAGALQRAQLRMLDDPRYRHPGYWAAFLLISDWL